MFLLSDTEKNAIRFITFLICILAMYGLGWILFAETPLWGQLRSKSYCSLWGAFVGLLPGIFAILYSPNFYEKTMSDSVPIRAREIGFDNISYQSWRRLYSYTIAERSKKSVQRTQIQLLETYSIMMLWIRGDRL